MKSDYQVRDKDRRSPEETLDQIEILDNPEDIIEGIQFVFGMNDSIEVKKISKLDLRMEISKDRESEFLAKLDEVLAPNVSIPREYRAIRHLRHAIYRAGSSLTEGKGFETLEKLGFYVLNEKDRIFVIADRRTPVPDGLPDFDFFNSVAMLMDYVSDELLDYSYLWSGDEKLYFAMVKMNGDMKSDYLNRPKA